MSTTDTDSNSDSPTRSDLETAYEAALNPYAKRDCVHVVFDGPEGRFDIEYAPYIDDDPHLNVCHLGRRYAGEDFTSETDLTPTDIGRDFCVFVLDADSAGGALSATLDVAAAVDGEPAEIEMRTLGNLPSWWPTILTPKEMR